jgi:hypothetical protein
MGMYILSFLINFESVLIKNELKSGRIWARTGCKSENEEPKYTTGQ